MTTKQLIGLAIIAIPMGLVFWVLYRTEKRSGENSVPSDGSSSDNDNGNSD